MDFYKHDLTFLLKKTKGQRGIKGTLGSASRTDFALTKPTLTPSREFPTSPILLPYRTITDARGIGISSQ